MGDWVWWALALQYEMVMIAVVGFMIGGIDDLLVDIFYIIYLIRRATICRLPQRMADLPPSPTPGKLAVFIPAWDESHVIGQMLDFCRAAWPLNDLHYFVGVYPNDPASQTLVASRAASDPRITMVVNPRPGPTTKGDCLNQLWHALLVHEDAHGMRFKGIVQHDAEDVVHPDELRLHDALLDRLDMIQLPVMPTMSKRSWCTARHYGDEFSESHAKTLLVRQFIGASIPAAGVGCAFSREILIRVASEQQGEPFGKDSLTEDYELGLKISRLGGRSELVRVRDKHGELIGTHALFPENLGKAVRQKARWTLGISWSGWDRMGWSGGIAERWMLMRDRRDPLAAIIISACFMAWLLQALLLFAPEPIAWIERSPSMILSLKIALAMLAWRIAVRAFFVFRLYGLSEAVSSIFRSIPANIIMIMAGFLAMGKYLTTHRGQTAKWEKTEHRFPDEQERRP